MPKRKQRQWQKLNKVTITATQYLLDFLSDMGSLLPQPFETPYSHQRRLRGLPTYPDYRLRQEVNRFKKRGWIEEAEKQGKKFLKLTRKGKLEALHKKLRTIKQSPKNGWDGKWRLAIFDIPEKGRRERDAIRRVLKSVGFFQFQKSAYIYPYEIPGEVIAYLKDSNLIQFIRFARIDKLDDAEDIKKYFKL
ncbi:MAG: hypothetical protein Q8M83_06665 [bacterium]|nr:hypothetical protein [bacterium]